MRIEKINRHMVYSHSCDGVIFYIGHGIELRPVETVRRNDKWKEVFTSRGYFDVEIIAYYDNDKDAFEHEKRLIKELKPSCNLAYNGYTHSPAVRAIIGEKSKGRVKSKEEIEKTRISNIGKSKAGVAVVCNETGAIFKSITDVGRWLEYKKGGHTSLLRHLDAKTDKVRGYSFSYYKNESPN